MLSLHEEKDSERTEEMVHLRALSFGNKTPTLDAFLRESIAIWVLSPPFIPDSEKMNQTLLLLSMKCLTPLLFIVDLGRLPLVSKASSRLPFP